MQIEAVPTKEIDFGDNDTDGFTRWVRRPQLTEVRNLRFRSFGLGIYIGFVAYEPDPSRIAQHFAINAQTPRRRHVLLFLVSVARKRTI